MILDIATWMFYKIVTTNRYLTTKHHKLRTYGLSPLGPQFPNWSLWFLTQKMCWSQKVLNAK